jgi:hypothetical protein
MAIAERQNFLVNFEQSLEQSRQNVVCASINTSAMV